jgi:hypothetical protein
MHGFSPSVYNLRLNDQLKFCSADDFSDFHRHCLTDQVNFNHPIIDHKYFSSDVRLKKEIIKCFILI